MGRRSVIYLDSSAHSNNFDIVLVGHFTFAPGATTGTITAPSNTALLALLNVEGQANLIRNYNKIARGDYVYIDNAPALDLSPPPAPVQGPTSTTLPSGSSWFDLPASPSVGDMAVTTNLLVPFFYDNAVVTSLGTNSQFPALPLIIAGTAIRNFVSFYDYNRISGGQIPAVTNAATANANNFDDNSNPGTAGNNQISGVVPGNNVSLRTSDDTARGPFLVQNNDGFIVIGGPAVWLATTYVGGTALADATEDSYWYRTTQYTGTLEWNGTIWTPASGSPALPTT